MNSPSKHLRTSCPNDDQDMISNLPLELKQQILTYLHIQESVRTSVLSSRWRHAWTSVSELVLDQQSLCKEESDATSEHFIHIVDKILSQHKTFPIYVFNLSAKEFCKGALDRWINELLKHPIEKFYIKSHDGAQYNVSSALYKFSKLKELQLINCTINMPNLFGGFQRLNALSLRYCTLKEDELEKLVSSCHDLEMLDLSGLGSMNTVNIDSRKLKRLEIIGDFQKIHLVTPFLLETYIMPSRVIKLADVGPSHSHDRVFRSAKPNYQVFHHPEKALPQRLNNLRKLFIMINFGDKNKSALALSLLKNAPNLETLILYVKGEVKPESNAVMVEFGKSAKFSFDYLKVVRLHCAKRPLFSEPMLLAFMKVLLRRAPRLEKVLSLSTTDPTEQLQFANKLQNFERASEKCVVCIVEKGPR